MVGKFGYDNSDLEGKSPFDHTNTDTGPIGHFNNVIPIPREFGLTQGIDDGESPVTEEDLHDMLVEDVENGLGE